MATSDEYDRAVGESIQTARAMRGWSQATLAAKLSESDSTNWHQQTILRLESGQRSLKVRELLRLAEVLDVSPLGLLSNSIRSANHHRDLDRDDVEWMVRDLNAVVSEVEGALNAQLEASRALEPALQRLRHQRDVLTVDLEQRVSEELRSFGPGEGPDDAQA